MTPEDRLAERLGRALDPGPLEPPPERVRALREHVAARSPRPRWPARLAAAAAVVAAFAWGAVIGHSPPDVLRDLAHDVGLPVDSSTLVRAREALHDLGVAISERDKPAAREADLRMLALVDRLDAEEKAEIVPVAHEVHERALELLEGAPDDPLS